MFDYILNPEEIVNITSIKNRSFILGMSTGGYLVWDLDDVSRPSRGLYHPNLKWSTGKKIYAS